MYINSTSPWLGLFLGRHDMNSSYFSERYVLRITSTEIGVQLSVKKYEVNGSQGREWARYLLV